MNQRCDISIVIPVYNEAHHIKACLDAIGAQTLLPFEVIVVDNNSTDQTATIAASYAFVTLIHESKQGIVHARNRGFNYARATLIARIDADTIVPPDWLRTIQQFYEEHSGQPTALTGGAVFRNMPMPRLANRFQGLLAFRASQLALGHHILWGSNMAIPKRVWQKVQAHTCTDLVIHEDIDLAIHLNQQGVNIVYLPSLRVNAVLKRVYSEQQSTWFNLKWWPRTLKRHGKKRWPITLLAAVIVFLCARATNLFSSERANKVR